MNKNTFILLAVLVGQYFLLCYSSYTTNTMKAGLMIIGVLGCFALFILARRLFPTSQRLISFFNAYIVIYFISVISTVVVYSQYAKPALFAITFLFALWYVLTYHVFPKKKTEEEISNRKRLLYFNLACTLYGIVFTSSVLFAQ